MARFKSANSRAQEAKTRTRSSAESVPRYASTIRCRRPCAWRLGMVWRGQHPRSPARAQATSQIKDAGQKGGHAQKGRAMHGHPYALGILEDLLRAEHVAVVRVLSAVGDVLVGLDIARASEHTRAAVR